MTAGDGNGRASGQPQEGLGPFRTGRTMSDVELGGMEAASQVISRFLEMVDGVARPAGPPSPEPQEGESPGFAQLRASVARALDLYTDLVIRSFDGYADLVEQTLRARGVRLIAGEDAQPVPLSARGPAGGQATARVWLHNTTDRSVSTTLRLTDLTGHDGEVVASSAAAFSPPTVADLGPQASTSVHLVIALADAPSGVYRGHVLAAGLPEAALPVELQVTDGDGEHPR